ncbi:AarF/ABC1/UbiB kinase family protein, partial [Limosilactobacillus fermentum]|nr:AarF/ABC1/UbiB kinase family protein [Limosilactobacillus fermentum]
MYLDFGMMGTLPASLAQGIAQVILAITTKDSYQISQAILRICNQTGPVDEQSFNHQLASFLRPYLNTGLKDYNF